MGMKYDEEVDYKKYLHQLLDKIIDDSENIGTFMYEKLDDDNKIICKRYTLKLKYDEIKY